MEAEERIRRLSRAINCLCLSTDTVLTARTEAELLDGICRVAVDVSGYRLAWIGYAEEVPDRLVRPVAQAGYDDGYLDQARIHWSDDERSTGPTGRAIRTSQAVACQDLTTEPSYAPWRAEALRRGYASSLALPLIIDGRVMGALNLYASEPDAFEAEEVALLERLAGSLAHGIAALRTQQEHQRSRAQVRDRNAQLKAIYTASPDMIFLHAADGRIVDANQRAVERYGRSRDELFHATPESMMGGDHTPEEALGYLLRAQAGEQLDFEWVARHAGGEEFPVEVRLRRLELEDDGSESPCVLAIVRDLADRLRIERERANVEKLRALGILAGGIAHDFNNLLTGITGNISLALDREQAAPVSHLLDQALAASSRAASLTKQLLTFSRGSATGHRRISLDAVVIEAARFALHGSAAKLETVFDEAPRYVDGDADQLSHAVHNLVLNAVQAMPRGGTVRIEGSNVELDAGDPSGLAPGRYAQIAVSDQGPGVEPELASRIFEPYFTTKESGSGLGLATSFSVARNHDGHLSFAPSESGARFVLLLPRKDGAAPEPQALTARDKPQPMRILVMDDQPTVRSVLLRLLEHDGHAASAVADGASAVAAYAEAQRRHEPFDLVIVDLTVPGGMGGREAVAELRSLDPAVRVIATTGYSEDRADVLTIFDGFLPKPFTLDELTAAIDSLRAGVDRRS